LSGEDIWQKSHIPDHILPEATRRLSITIELQWCTRKRYPNSPLLGGRSTVWKSIQHQNKWGLFQRTGDLLAAIYFRQAWAMRTKPAMCTKRYERPGLISDAGIEGLNQWRFCIRECIERYKDPDGPNDNSLYESYWMTSSRRSVVQTLFYGLGRNPFMWHYYVSCMFSTATRCRKNSQREHIVTSGWLP